MRDNIILWIEMHLSNLMTKPTKWHVHPVKTQISLAISPVWSESSLSAWRNLGSLNTHWVHSEDWSDWMDAQANLSLHRPYCWFCHDAAHLYTANGNEWWDTVDTFFKGLGLNFKQAVTKSFQFCFYKLLEDLRKFWIAPLKLMLSICF